MTNSSSTFSLSIQRDHKVYRSKPVDLNEILPRTAGKSNVRSSASVSSIRSCKCCADVGKEQNVSSRNPQEPSNNLLSQNTAVAGSVKNPIKNFGCRKFVGPESTNPFKKCNCIDRTHVSHRSRCLQDKLCISSCQSRRCCVNYQNDCHCCHHQHSNVCCLDCWHSSCHCQHCARYSNHSCCIQAPTCSHTFRPEKRPSLGASCENHAKRVCSQNRWNPVAHCSASCNTVEHTCCRHCDDRLYSCTCFDSRQHCSSKCYNHCGPTLSHEHSCRHNKRSLKSLEHSFEKGPDHTRNRMHLNSVEIDSADVAAKRTQKWVQEWTPCIGPSPPPDKPHSKANVFSLKRRNNCSHGSKATISSSDSDSEEDKSRKRNHTTQKDMDCNKDSLKTLASNSSQSTTSNKRARFQSECINQKKLFNPQDYSEEKSTVADFVEESTPFSSGQAEFDKNLGLENRLPSSLRQEKPNIGEGASANGKEMKEMDVVQSSSQQEDSNKETGIIRSKEMSPADTKQTDATDHLSNITVEIESNKKKLSEVLTLAHSHLDGNNEIIVSNESLISLGKPLSAGNCEQMGEVNLIQSKKSSEETFPELRLDSLSADKPCSNDTPITISDTIIQPNMSGNCNEIPEEKLRIINESNPSSKSEEKISNNKSLSLIDYSKIKLNDTEHKEKVKKPENTVELRNSEIGRISSRSCQTLSECDDQMELVCESKLKKRKRRKRKHASDRVSRSTGSAKSFELIDLRNSITNGCKETVESSVSCSSTFRNAQSNSSQNSKLSSSEKWCLKPLHELRLNPTIAEAYLKMLPCTSKQRSYDLRLYKEFQAIGIIIGTIPDIIESPFSIVRGYCSVECQKSYAHEEYVGLEEFECVCTFCRYKSHWTCPGCKAKGKHNPLCVYYTFEVHFFDGQNVLRIEVENQEGVKLLGCTPTVFLKDSSSLMSNLRQIVVNSPSLNQDPVPLLKATIKSILKDKSTILIFQKTSLQDLLASSSLLK